MGENSFCLNGKVAAVTGGAQGLGLAMAQALAKAGAKVALLDIDMEKCQAEAGKLESEYEVESLAIYADVRKLDQMEAAVAQIVERFGGLDIFVNNAGICKNIKAEEMTLEEWQEVIDINLTGVFIGSQVAGKQMIKQGGGSIINIASMSGSIVNVPQPQCSYNASKAGVIHLTKSLASEWAQYSIRVNSISPGYMKTAMTEKTLQTDMAKDWWLRLTPMGRPGLSHELGGAVVFLASDASSFMTGADLIIDGGYTVW
ncbi:MAG: SDR family oxidoreductase [Firmicutes bacterium]|nr:SDR family oxidoreductase [Bacillota bacterium]